MAELKSTYVSGSLKVSGNTILDGNLTVNGTSSYVYTEDLKVKDKFIEIATGADTTESLDQAGIQFGTESLSVWLKYSSSKDAFVFSKPINATVLDKVASASYADEVPWGGVTAKPDFSASFVSGKFNTKTFKPLNSNVEIQIPTLADHVGALATGSSVKHISTVENKLVSLENTTGSLNVFSASTLQSISDLITSASYLRDAKLNTSNFNSWTGSNGSLLKGSSSYALTASYALNAQGHYLPITGGVLSGKLTINGSLEGGSLEQGAEVTASGVRSHAQGGGTRAAGDYSHAEGKETIAASQYSHAEGCSTVANNLYAHAEGSGSRAEGVASHVEGLFNKTICEGQTVVGRYNSASKDYAFIVGNGTGSYTSHSYYPESHSNALGVRWNGDIDMQPGNILHGTASFTTTASYALVAQSVIVSGGLTIESASHAGEVHWNNISHKPEFISRQYIGGEDIAIVKINEQTSSVNSYLNEDIKIMGLQSNVGLLKNGDVLTKGMSLSDILKLMLVQKLYPGIATQASITQTLSGIGQNVSVEIGSTIGDITQTISTHNGSYNCYAGQKYPEIGSPNTSWSNLVFGNVYFNNVKFIGGFVSGSSITYGTSQKVVLGTNNIFASASSYKATVTNLPKTNQNIDYTPELYVEGGAGSAALVSTGVKDSSTYNISFTGVYPCFVNIVNGTYVENPVTKLGIQKSKEFVLVEVPTEVGSTHKFKFAYPLGYSILHFEVRDLEGKFVPVESSYLVDQGPVYIPLLDGTSKEYRYLTTSGNNGILTYRITLNKDLDS